MPPAIVAASRSNKSDARSLAENDRLKYDHDMAWYRRCFLRRFEATKLIAEVCIQLKRCMWTQLSIDNEGNDQRFRFTLVEVEDRERSSRMVKPIKEWWMAKEFEFEHGGDLPEDMVEET
jgi:hypothetical protein